MRTNADTRQNVSMRAVVQRVDGASVEVQGKVIGSFTGPGLLVLIGVSVDDDDSKCAVLADKIWKLRIFEAVALNSAEMNEYIRTIFLLDEAVALAAIKPLYDSFCHCNTLQNKN